MFGLRWDEWMIGAVGLWLVATPCLFGLSPSEELWNLGFLTNMGLAGVALAGMGLRALFRDAA
jgi:hypothetical protein